MSAPSKAIDPARVGLSKSLLTTPCERKGWYSEAVRLPSGARIRTPMPPRVHFGRAVDRIHADIVYAAASGNWPNLSDVAQWTADALDEANTAYADGDWSEQADMLGFAAEVGHSIDLFRSQEDGFPRLRPFLEGIRVQGDNGRTLQAGDVIGTPDYLLPDAEHGEPDGVLDVKTTERKYYPDKFTDSAEMPIYAHLFREEFGRPPTRLAYQVYVRVQRPYWQWLEIPGGEQIADLGAAIAESWRKRMALGDADLFATDRRFCGDCPFAKPMPEVGFGGCAVGMLTLAVSQEEAA